MGLNIMRAVCFVVGALLGYAVYAAFKSSLPFEASELAPNGFGFALVFALLGFLFSTLAYRYLLRFNAWFVEQLAHSSGHKILGGAFGALFGFVLAYGIYIQFIGPSLVTMPPAAATAIGNAFVAIVGIIMVYIGAFMFSNLNFGGVGGPGGFSAQPKILDTNIIIDGRIADIFKAHFIEGPVIVPQSVLRELQKIADSPDILKRNRGKLGLDNLEKFRGQMGLPIEIYDDYDEAETEINDVDTQLIHLAQKIGAKIITNDYNLHKIAVLQGVDVMNINELANALKPVVLPGEELRVQIMKHGKEQGQGVGYLDDGTMIVVEGGDRHIGKEIPVSVTSLMQTAAGRLIFARPV
ncbi:MAG TPA: PIN domain-containing protein, partial [bacterium]|nr:PIN domain-containing protein [bacterium]